MVPGLLALLFCNVFILKGVASQKQICLWKFHGGSDQAVPGEACEESHVHSLILGVVLRVTLADVRLTALKCIVLLRVSCSCKLCSYFLLLQFWEGAAWSWRPRLVPPFGYGVPLWSCVQISESQSGMGLPLASLSNHPFLPSH